METEVRYQMLRPAQVRARRTACPVVYIPVGTIEWHGPQNPLGADTLQAEGLALACARAGGGLVFPPLYYGEKQERITHGGQRGGQGEDRGSHGSAA